MAKHISQKNKKKKTRKLVISNESTEDDEWIPETPEANLNTECSNPEQTIVIPPEASVSKSSHEEARTIDVPVNVSNTDTNVTMGEGDSKIDNQGNPDTIITETFVSLPPQIIPITSTIDSPTFENIINQPFTSIFCS